MKLQLEGTRLLDVEGREVILRGVNTGGRSKFYPFFPFPFVESGLAEQAAAPSFEAAAETYLDRLVDWGFNIARMPFSWEALEPTRGSYDATYLGRYRRFAELAGERDIRVIVDFHQDVFAWPYCGDGFPLWTLAAPVPERPADCSEWFNAYLAEVSEQATAFDRFWANVDGMRDSFQDMWAHMAAELWTLDAVVGFEIVNEPGKGSADEETWAAEVLKPFYEETAATIRAAAPGALVFFDSTGVDAVNASTKVPRPTGDFFVFAPHYYHMSAYIPGFAHNLDQIRSQLGQWAAYRDRWTLPIIIGEFGIKPAAFGAGDYYGAHWDAFDVHLLHATMWEYSTTVDDWNQEAMRITGPDPEVVETVAIEVAVRAYPRAVAGNIVSYYYDAETREGELVFEAQAGGVTELATPARLYPEGISTEVSGVRGCAVAEGGRLLLLVEEAGLATLSFAPTL